MKLDPVLLNMACSWSMKAYEDENKKAIKIESRLTSTTVYIAKRKSIDVIAFTVPPDPGLLPEAPALDLSPGSDLP